MDLKNAYDHPVKALSRLSAELFESARESESNTTMRSFYEQRGNAYGVAATRLHGWELENGVTYAALHTDTLEDLKRAYNGGSIEEIEAFVRLTEELLGLDDD